MVNKITSQLTYPDLPTTGATHKKDRITLPKVVAKENNRGSITSVQKAGRVSAKRVAEEQARENRAGGGESGDQVEGRAPKRER
jgi:hypothetical protein